jgi:hypothetical protein
MHRSGLRRGLVWLAALAVVVLAPAAAQANPSFYETPIFGLGTAHDGSLLVADAGQGIVNADTGALVVSLPGVTDFASRGRGKLWAITSGGGGPGAFLYSVEGGVATQVADLFAYESANNPHPAAIESNPFDVVDLGRGRALVADAAGNDLLRVDLHGNIELVAVFPDELVSTANIKHLAGCPGSHADFCDLPPMMPAQAVSTSVAVGPDGAYYVGELKGFPAPTGASRVWRVDSHASGAQCGSSPSCTVVLDHFTSIIDVVFRNGRLYVAQFDDASWAAIEIFQGEGALGGSVHACSLATKACVEVVDAVPMLTAIAFRGGHLWGNTWSLVPGRADAVPLT